MLDFESFQQYVKDNIKDFLPSECEGQHQRFSAFRVCGC